MAAGAAPIAHHPHYDVRWKSLLLALCALSAVWIVSVLLDNVGFGGRPWYGWWEAGFSAGEPPYRWGIDSVEANGGAARSGFLKGDWFDWRQQSLQTRERLILVQPMATSPTIIAAHRGPRTVPVGLIGSTLAEGNVRLKVLELVPTIVYPIWFVGCAMLLAVRRASVPVARLLSLILLSLTLSMTVPTWPMVLPSAAVSLIISIVAWGFAFLAQVLLVRLSLGMGARSVPRSVLEAFAYAAIAACALDVGLAYYGALTLRVDPASYAWWLYSPTIVSVIASILAPIAVVAVAIAATVSTHAAERPRTAWLLLPIPFAVLINSAAIQLSNTTTDWVVSQVFSSLAALALLLGAVMVTYALLKRHVLDFEFVLSRTLVVATLSLIVVAAFVLLEWLLGTGLAGASHATGLIANGALALVLGLSMNFIHKRVDTFIDLVFFRKRHENERALLDFSKEAAYVTEPNALLDQTIANIEQHTDAGGAALLLEENGTYAAARSFGDVPQAIGENDAAILALKTWRKPLDPHHHATALLGALALPMLTRGRLLGVLLLGEQTGGEAYAPDEVEALSQFAHGVGSALDALSFSADGSRDGVLDAVRALGEQIRSLPDAIAVRLR